VALALVEVGHLDRGDAARLIWVQRRPGSRCSSYNLASTNASITVTSKGPPQPWRYGYPVPGAGAAEERDHKHRMNIFLLVDVELLGPRLLTFFYI
jgi:hypothetical protein